MDRMIDTLPMPEVNATINPPRPIRILTFTPVWKRVHVLEIMLAGVRRLVNYKPWLFEIIPFFVVSEPEGEDAVKRAGFNYVNFKNDPLGEKKNFGLNEALKLEWDFMLELGSDDLVTNQLLEIYHPFFETKERAFGINRCYFYHCRSAEVASWESTVIIGLGRCISRETIERMQFVNFIWSKPGAGPNGVHRPGVLEPMPLRLAESNQKHGGGFIAGKEKLMVWEEWRNKALDASSLRNLTKINVPHNLVPVTTCHALDIKNGESITNFSLFKESDLSAMDVFDCFPDERDMIIDLSLRYATGSIK